MNFYNLTKKISVNNKDFVSFFSGNFFSEFYEFIEKNNPKLMKGISL